MRTRKATTQCLLIGARFSVSFGGNYLGC